MLRNQTDIFLERRDVGTAGFFSEPAAQRLQRPDVADAGLGFDHRVNVGDRLQRLRRIERRALGEFDQNVDRIGAGQLGVEAPARRHRLLLVRHLIGEPVARLEMGIDQRQAADKDHRDQAEQAGPADHAHRDPVAEIAQRLDPGVGALEFDREDLFVADQQHPEHRHQREHRDQRDHGGGKSRLAEFADQVGIRELQGNERDAGGAVGEHAGRPDHQHRVPERGVFVLARDQAVARREGQLHRVREADHHDQRRHHVQEHVEAEIGPSEHAEREQDRDHRRERGDDHERPSCGRR